MPAVTALEKVVLVVTVSPKGLRKQQQLMPQLESGVLREEQRKYRARPATSSSCQRWEPSGYNVWLLLTCWVIINSWWLLMSTLCVSLNSHLTTSQNDELDILLSSFPRNGN